MNISESDLNHIINMIANLRVINNVPNFVAITGCPAVGKNYFAEQLKEILNKKGIRTEILKCDDFLDPNYYDEECFHPHFNYDLAHSTVQQIKAVCNNKKTREDVILF